MMNIKLLSVVTPPSIYQEAHVISDMGRIAELNPFTPDYEAIQIPIIDAGVRYDCAYNG